MGRGAEAVHEGREVWGGGYSQMSLGNLAAPRSVLIDATEGWSAGEKLPSPGSDLLVSMKTPPRMLQFIGQTQGVVRNHTRPTLWPRGLHVTTVGAYAGALPAVPGAPTETRKCFGSTSVGVRPGSSEAASVLFRDFSPFRAPTAIGQRASARMLSGRDPGTLGCRQITRSVPRVWFRTTPLA